MKSASLGRYAWGEFSRETPKLTVSDVIRGIARHVIGLRALNASWDSGLLHPSDTRRPPDWTYAGSHAVSPPITQAMAENWPYSGGGFDEWYFFREVPSVFNLNAFCNYVGVSLAEAGDVPFLGGISASSAESVGETGLG
jgi:hypothetical protein